MSVERIRELYFAERSRGQRRSGAECWEIACLMDEQIGLYGSAHRFSKATGLAAAAISHYTGLLRLLPEGVAALVSGRITFKAARGIGRIEERARQRDALEVILSGIVACTNVERLVAVMRRFPDVTAERAAESLSLLPRQTLTIPNTKPVPTPANRCGHCGGFILSARAILPWDDQEVCANCARVPARETA